MNQTIYRLKRADLPTFGRPTIMTVGSNSLSICVKSSGFLLKLLVFTSLTRFSSASSEVLLSKFEFSDEQVLGPGRLQKPAMLVHLHLKGNLMPNPTQPPIPTLPFPGIQLPKDEPDIKNFQAILSSNTHKNQPFTREILKTYTIKSKFQFL